MQGKEIQILDYIEALKEYSLEEGFDVHTYGTCDELPLLGLTRKTQEEKAPCIYLCAGIHGDEPAGPLALLELLKEGAFSKKVNWVLCPAMNPIGLKHGSRFAHCGQDLNRDYKHSLAYETQQHIEWLSAHCTSFDLHISLHEDWEAEGFYLYELRPENAPNLSPIILEAARAHCPIDLSETIDHFPAENGIIYTHKITDDIYSIPYWPQGVYLAHAGLTSTHYTLESPSSIRLERRILAHKSALISAINTYCNEAS